MPCLHTVGGQVCGVVHRRPGAAAVVGLCCQTGPAATSGSNQFLLWSTRRFFLIQGIMSRSLAPTTSISCCAVSLRRAVIDG
ncbi:MAG: hypothetical protein AW08_01463 [Candidatus Accumulibacter adjunctus]|uniref:Uncharacterized protein n=1 Tax=Candidatus Accumulibacter adjunctus TaxID=1454001 RepID=A0A011NUH8_9PROT|nr:MAG: hypothetical protein AW08_01463 [Candidatus Accumulibacter adjunctus]